MRISFLKSFCFQMYRHGDQCTSELRCDGASVAASEQSNLPFFCVYVLHENSYVISLFFLLILPRRRQTAVSIRPLASILPQWRGSLFARTHIQYRVYPRDGKHTGFGFPGMKNPQNIQVSTFDRLLLLEMLVRLLCRPTRIHSYECVQLTGGFLYRWHPI